MKDKYIHFAHNSFYYDGKYIAVAIRDPIGSRVNIYLELYSRKVKRGSSDVLILL